MSHTVEVVKDGVAGNGAKTERSEETQKHRLQFDFSAEAYDKLQRLRERAEARTNAELVRNALRLYEWFLDQKAEKYRIQLVKDDRVKEVELIL